MDEELHPLRPGEREARHELARVGDEMRSRLQGQAVGLQPRLELGRAGEDADAGALLEAVTRFLPDDAGAVVEAVFKDRGRRDPQFPNLDAVFGLVFRCVLKPEEIGGPAAMVVVEVRVAGDIIVVALRGAEVGPEFGRQVDAAVPPIVGVAHVGVVDEQFLAVGEVEARAIGVPERVKSQYSGHGRLLRFERTCPPTASGRPGQVQFMYKRCRRIQSAAVSHRPSPRTRGFGRKDRVGKYRYSEPEPRREGKRCQARELPLF